MTYLVQLSDRSRGDTPRAWRAAQEVTGTLTIFALFSALLYGTADFLGGAAARRTAVLGVLVVSVPFGAAIIVAAALLAGSPGPTATELAWGAASGLAGGFGLIVFYAGLAAGPMSLVAPLSALAATLLPVGVALAGGEHLPGPAFLGMAACLAAIVLVSMDQRGPPRAAQAGPRWPPRASRLPAGRGLLYGLVAGVAFGLFFVLVKQAAPAGGFWPLVASRAAGTLVVGAAAVWTRSGPPQWSHERRTVVMALLAGAFDACANVLYVLAVSAGLFTIAVVLTSLYPAVTVLFARVVLGERMRRVQGAGLVLAAVGIVLVTAA